MDWFTEKDTVTKEQFERASRIAALACFATHKPRIFQSGKNAEGEQIGTYVRGSKDDNGNPRGGKKVILVFTEYMKGDYETTEANESQIGFGFTDPANSDKADWNEVRYDALIFALTDKEEEIYLRTLANELGFK
jgi:hypothetical protein